MDLHTRNGHNALDAAASDSTLEFQRELISLIPNLRAFARMLCGNRAIAEDLSQEALAKAWCARNRFELGTDLKAWLFTIFRNEFYSYARRAWRETNWNSEKGERIAAPANEQSWATELSDTARVLRMLPDTQREALILVAVGGSSYEEAARICGVPVGTIKSRVVRARAALSSLLDGGTALPARSAPRRMDAANDILVQLGVLSGSNVHAVAA